MVLEKAFYRLLGTVVGCSVALLMLAVFPQQVWPLFGALALWVGLCTGGAAMYRNQQSYSFVLAGYTACMIAIPAIEHPAGVFALAVTRVTEVGLGIICAAVVHDTLLPRPVSRQVMRTVQARYDKFIGFCQQVLEQHLTPAEVELHHLRFAADIAALESGRAAAFFEAAHARSHTRQLHAFNNAFMSALTTFYTLHRLTHRLRRDGASAAVQAAVAPLQALLAQALKLPGAQLAAQWRQVQADLARRIIEARTELGEPERPQRIDFDTAVELLERYARDLDAFLALYQGLTEHKRQQVSDPVAYSPRTPPAIVLASGVRAAIAVLAGAACWYWLAWPYAATAIIMTTIFCALASSSPRPTAMIRQVLAGFLAGIPLAFATEYTAVVHASNYAMLVLAALPLFALACYLITDPRRGGMGVGMSLFAAQLVAPLNLMHYDPESFLSNELALPAGVLLAWLIFATVLPDLTMGHRQHVAAALWREALGACRSRLFRLKHRFDNRVRDLLNQLNAASGPHPGKEARQVVRQGLTLLELGHAVIELRQLVALSGPGPARAALQLCVQRLGAYFGAPSRARGEAVLQAILDAGGAVRADLPGADEAHRQRLHTALADLHSMYTSLLDQLASMPPSSTP
jgi:uncharacterized membrane protein YccC